LWGSKFGIEKDDLILQMDIFVHPSRNEGLPASVLEASSMGIPCIVSLATNVASYITQYNAGIAIANENITELTNALILLHKKWEEGNLESIKNNAQKMVREAFNWQHIVNEFDRLYTI
jgi:glycosyltransferase involved in cell wall biosynthesis